MSLRDQRQQEFADRYLSSRGRGILNLCPRFGKCRVAIKVFKAMKPKRILIAYPDVKIKKAWQNEFEATKFDQTGVCFSTHRSLFKHEQASFDIVVIDEIHLLSPAQIKVAKELMKHNKNILGLTGTLSTWTGRTLDKELGLKEIGFYSIDTAIKEGVIVDYEIHVVKVPLNDTIKNNYKGKLRTEKKQFDAYSFMINKLEEEQRNTKFLRLGRMRIIQNSISKLDATKSLLKQFENERVLVFTGLTATADKLGCPVYHSKKGEKQTFEDFSNGKGNHLAVVKIGNTGVTYKPLDKVIINYFDSNSENLAQKINRCMAMEYGTPDKKANIWIICSDEPVELAWLDKALEFFDINKINNESGGIDKVVPEKDGIYPKRKGIQGTLGSNW